jgi:hypothetical protein
VEVCRGTSRVRTSEAVGKLDVDETRRVVCVYDLCISFHDGSMFDGGVESQGFKLLRMGSTGR